MRRRAGDAGVVKRQGQGQRLGAGGSGHSGRERIGGRDRQCGAVPLPARIGLGIACGVGERKADGRALADIGNGELRIGGCPDKQGGRGAVGAARSRGDRHGHRVVARKRGAQVGARSVR